MPSVMLALKSAVRMLLACPLIRIQRNFMSSMSIPGGTYLAQSEAGLTMNLYYGYMALNVFLQFV